MEFKVFNAKISWYDSSTKEQKSLIGEGSDQVGLYNWCVEQLEYLSQVDYNKHIRFMIVEDDTYNTYDEYYGEEENEEEKTETERQTTKTSEP